MFECQITVTGEYYKGLIKLWNGSYQFYEEPYGIDPSDRVWESDILIKMSKELLTIAKKIEELNKSDVTYRNT